MHTRRNFLRATSLGAFGLSLPRLLELEAQAKAAGSSKRPRSLIFLYLYGGPSQIDTWDMKPDAPEEFRGEFAPIRTTVPGQLIVEHLPQMARLAQHYTVIRTLHHNKRNHQPAGCQLFTGVDPGSDNAGQTAPKPDDPPALGSLVLGLNPAKGSPVPPFVMVPAKLHDQGSAFKGQTAGWLGSAYEPLLIQQDPSSTSFRVDGFGLHQGVPMERLERRMSLLEVIDESYLDKEHAPKAMNQFQQKAFDLIHSSQGKSAFDLSHEPVKLRERYGKNPFGQGCLLARRLIEAGARVVTVSYCTSSGHHEWDTHSGNFTKLKKTLLPRLDQAYPALMEDLLARGMLEDTVVYLGGEFGRTPKVGFNAGTGAGKDGRDHYPSCFCGVIAGGNIKPGYTYGESDAKAAFPAKDGVPIEDLYATIMAGLGLDPHGTVYTRDNRPMPVTHGKPIVDILR
ncbi:MAG: DUF1501 domain-containing protein [Gemmataceae bacterium]